MVLDRDLAKAFGVETKLIKRNVKSYADIEFEDEVIEPEVYGKAWNDGTVVLYQPDDSLQLEVMIRDDTVWLSQDKMAQLFGTQRQAVSKHLKNIYDSNELEKNQTCSILELVQSEGGINPKDYIKCYRTVGF